LPRHTDEHHYELKKAHPVASGDENVKRLNQQGHIGYVQQAEATRRSVTWLVYLNDDWNAAVDGGELRVHERLQPSAARVGARGPDLQIGWLRATATQVIVNLIQFHRIKSEW